jgi:hypothetical protein
MGDQATSQDGNDILQRLRQMFAEDPKGKGKVIETPSSKQGQLKIQSANNPPLRKQICDMGFSIPTFIPGEKEKQLATYSSSDQHGEQNHQPQSEGINSKEEITIPGMQGIANHQVFRNRANAENSSSGRDLDRTQVNDTLTTQMDTFSQQKTKEEMLVVGGSSKATSAKRSAPSADHTSQLETKKQMPMQMNQSNTQGMDMQTIDANKMRPSIMQCAIW